MATHPKDARLKAVPPSSRGFKGHKRYVDASDLCASSAQLAHVSKHHALPFDGSEHMSILPSRNHERQSEAESTYDRGLIHRAFDTLQISQEDELPRAGSTNYLFGRLPLGIRQRIYGHLLTKTTAPLMYRSQHRYAKWGVPINALRVSRQMLSELLVLTVKYNTFNVVIGHHVVPGSALSPATLSDGILPPPLLHVTQLHIHIEIDLDSLFTPFYQAFQDTAVEDDTVFGSVTTICNIIKDGSLPKLQGLTISTYEVVPISKRIHLTCRINEAEVQRRYAEILQPFLDLALPHGLYVAYVDAAYDRGPTFTEPSERFVRATDYIRIMAKAISALDIEAAACVSPYPAYVPVLNLYLPRPLPLHIAPYPTASSIRAADIFKSMRSTQSPPTSPSLPSYTPTRSPPQPSGRPFRAPSLPTSPKKSLRRPSLRQMWNEGASVLRGNAPAKSTPSSPGRVKISGKTEKKGSKESDKEGKSDSKLAVGKWFAEGADFTLKAFANTSSVSRGRNRPAGNGKGEKARWSLG